MRTAGGAIALTCLLAGCVSAPPRTQPELRPDPPASWTAVTDISTADPIADWWVTFDDPQLTELVARTLERNHDLAAAAARVDRAVATARIAGADLEPVVGLDVGGVRTRRNFAALAIPGVPPESSVTSTSFDASVGISWEADLWGRLRADARAALADAQAAEAELRGARLSLAGQTAKLWFSVLESREQLRLALETAESFRESADQVRSRYASGIRPAVDLRLALSNASAADALVERRRRELDATSRALAILAADYPSRDPIDARKATTLPATPPPAPAGLPSELVGRRPDVLAAERRLVAADQRYRSARRSLYPRLTLTGSGGTSTDSLRDILDGDFRIWSLAAGLTQPLFQGGRLRAGVSAADAASRELLETYASTVLTAFSEVESALAAERFLADRERHLAETARQLESARRLAQERYRTGVGDYLTVLQSQTSELEARSQLLVVRRERLTLRVDLHLALGGGFETVGEVSS